jgi:hypothetical protein
LAYYYNYYSQFGEVANFVFFSPETRNSVELTLTKTDLSKNFSKNNLAEKGN